MTFPDHFSAQAEDYARYRPQYPPAFLSFLSQLTPEHQVAWDCATGNGQVATDLTQYFEQVYASDASEQQIANVLDGDRVYYFVSPAESTPLADHSIDLITVAQAAHWFDLPRFFTEAKRVLKPDGVLAIWCYGWFNILDSSEPLEHALQSFLQAIDPFWPPERSLVDDRYQTIEFPFVEEETPDFTMQVEWSIEQLVGYLRTWSATQYFLDKNGEMVLNNYFESIFQAWGDPQTKRTVAWPITVRVGKQPRP